MNVVISSAYSLQSSKGNAITALRIESLLKAAGIKAQAIDHNEPPAAEALIALHAIKTLGCSRAFKAAQPDGRLLLCLTGTDLYRDLEKYPKLCEEALQLADVIVLSQEASLASLPVAFRSKARVIHQSVMLPSEVVVAAPPQPSFALIAHLREVKNPSLLNAALKQLPGEALHAFTIGKALDRSYLPRMEQAEREDPRFHWLGELPPGETVSWIRQVTATVNTSQLEGGSNAVAESITLGTPVLATRIEGNLGLLGEYYDGYFPAGDASALAHLLRRCLSEPSYLKHLKEQIQARQSHFSQARETQDWIDALHT